MCPQLRSQFDFSICLVSTLGRRSSFSTDMNQFLDVDVVKQLQSFHNFPFYDYYDSFVLDEGCRDLKCSLTRRFYCFSPSNLRVIHHFLHLVLFPVLFHNAAGAIWPRSPLVEGTELNSCLAAEQTEYTYVTHRISHFSSVWKEIALMSLLFVRSLPLPHERICRDTKAMNEMTFPHTSNSKRQFPVQYSPFRKRLLADSFPSSVSSTVNPRQSRLLVSPSLSVFIFAIISFCLRASNHCDLHPMSHSTT